MQEISAVDFVIDILEVCTKHNYISFRVVRNFKIQNEYEEMRAQGIAGKDAMEALGEKYYLGTKSIDAILYRQRYK